MFLIAPLKDFKEQVLAWRYGLSRLIFRLSEHTLTCLDSARKWLPEIFNACSQLARFAPAEKLTTTLWAAFTNMFLFVIPTYLLNCQHVLKHWDMFYVHVCSFNCCGLCRVTESNANPGNGIFECVAHGTTQPHLWFMDINNNINILCFLDSKFELLFWQKPRAKFRYRHPIALRQPPARLSVSI